MKEVCADAGYEREEEYEFMERFDTSAYDNYFHVKQTKKWEGGYLQTREFIL